MGARLNPAFTNSIHVVPAADLAEAKAAVDKAEPAQIGLAPSQGGPKITWPILVPNDDLKAQLAEDPKLFGEYLTQAIDANAAYFFPDKHGKDPVYGQRARELFDEAIGLVRELYPPSTQQDFFFGKRDSAYRLTDRQVDRVFQRVYGGGRPTRPGDIWNDDSHWPISPVLQAKFEDDGISLTQVGLETLGVGTPLAYGPGLAGTVFKMSMFGEGANLDLLRDLAEVEIFKTRDDDPPVVFDFGKPVRTARIGDDGSILAMTDLRSALDADQSLASDEGVTTKKSGEES